MCGIIGGVGLTQEEAHRGLLQIKRGDDGITVTKNGDVVLGSRRHLVKESHKHDVRVGESDQPYDSDDRMTHLVFNGELYNFAEFREELSAKGKAFHTDGDTEGFLKLY